MADLDVCGILKNASLKIEESSLKGRKEGIQNIIEICLNTDLSEDSVKEICKAIYYVIPIYKDSFSQHWLRQLLKTIITKHTKLGLKYLLPSYINVSSTYKNIIPTASTAQSCLYLLQSTTEIYIHVSRHHKDILPSILPKIIETQSVLLTSIAGAGLRKKYLKAYKMLRYSWNCLPGSVQNYLEVLKSLEQTINTVILGAMISKYLIDLNNTEQLDKYKNSFIDIFIKSFITCKKKPSKALIESCYPLLKLVTLEEFKSTLLPSLQKALLRSPEVIIECVGLVLGGLQIYLNGCSFEIGKSLIVNLHAKDDLARDDAAFACKMLAEKINDHEAFFKNGRSRCVRHLKKRFVEN